MFNDPTYVKADIEANPIWKLAFLLSEFDNETAPVGWSKYILIARLLLEKFDLTEKIK